MLRYLTLYLDRLVMLRHLNRCGRVSNAKTSHSVSGKVSNAKTSQCMWTG